MAGEKYCCGEYGKECTLETIGFCTYFCNPQERADATLHPGTCGRRKTIASQRNKRYHPA